jgi:hypothetical protein
MAMTAGGAAMQMCRWCGLMHGHVCPYVKALDFYPDGTVKRVEFFQETPGVRVTGWLMYPRIDQPLSSVSDDGKAGTAGECP